MNDDLFAAIALPRHLYPLLESSQYLQTRTYHLDRFKGGTSSFITTCKRLDIDPFAYLRDIFQRISTHPQSRLAELLPDEWRTARRATGDC
jgi:hypothetical protein